jgi:hypothetical protein
VRARAGVLGGDVLHVAAEGEVDGPRRRRRRERQNGECLELGTVAGSLAGPDDELLNVAEAEGQEGSWLMPRVARRLHRYEALAGHPSLGPAVARLLHQRLEALGSQKGVAAYGELLRHPLTVLTPDDAHRYAAVSAWPLLHRCHDSRRSVPTWERLGLTLSRRFVPKMFP